MHGEPFLIAILSYAKNPGFSLSARKPKVRSLTAIQDDNQLPAGDSSVNLGTMPALTHIQFAVILWRHACAASHRLPRS